MNVLIISGTNRNNSKSLQISRMYAARLTAQHIACEIVNLADLPDDFLVNALYENGGKNASFNVLSHKVSMADKIVFVVPEYNGSFPGVLKAFIDGLPYPGSFKNKKAALVGLSSGVMGGALALSHLTDILSYLGMNVLGNRVKLYRIEENYKDGQIQNKIFNELIDAQVREFIDF